MGDGRWKVTTQAVISKSTPANVPNEVIVSSQLVDCRQGRSEVIRLDGIAPGRVSMEEGQGLTFKPALSNFDEYNLWALACRGAFQRYRWP